MRINRFVGIMLAAAAAFAIWAGCANAKSTAPAVATTQPLRVSAVRKPGANDGRIAYVVARLLEQVHYSQRILDKGISTNFFDGYIDMLDPRHENFLQSDLAEFSHFRTNLDVLTVGGQGKADLDAAFLIYQRYTERLEQHTSYVFDLLKKDKFKFTSDEKIQIDRRKEPFPKDLDEAKVLWRQRLHYDYLQEKLARSLTETNGTIQVKLSQTNAMEIPKTIERNYRWITRMMTNMDSDKILMVYLNALAHAYDPHSDYMSAPKAQDFSIHMNLALFGIGAQLQEDFGYCTIMELTPGGPAIKSKLLKKGDRIVAVAQSNSPPVDVVDMELEKVVQLVRGPKGSEVNLTISPAEDRAARRIVTLIRDEIKLEDAEAKAKLVEFPHGNRIGIIDLPSFYASMNLSGSSSRATPKSTSADVAKLVKKLKDERVSGIILDLRSNPGGSLEEAVRFSGLFIKDGPIVQARNPDGQVAVEYDPDSSQLYDGPLLVLVNHFSASASEIAAGALQDYGRAVVVGDEATHGKGTVQNLNQLRQYVWPRKEATNDPGTLKLTIRKFYRISGASTQLKGVVPDIILPNMLDHSTQIGEGASPNALPWDTIEPVKFEKYNLVQPLLGELQARSSARIQTNQDFLYIKQDIEEFKKKQADKTATLNERQSIKDRQEAAARKFAREREREARPGTDAKIYEITVKNSADPGLPAPISVTNEVQTATSKPAIPAHKKTATGADPMLEESQRILLDYITLLSKNAVAEAKK